MSKSHIYKLGAKLISGFLVLIFIFLNFIIPVVQVYHSRNIILTTSELPVPKERSFVLSNIVYDAFPGYEERIMRFFQWHGKGAFLSEKDKVDVGFWANARNVRGIGLSDFMSLASFLNFIPKNVAGLLTGIEKDIFIDVYEIGKDNPYIVECIGRSDFDDQLVLECEAFEVSDEETTKVRETLMGSKHAEKIRNMFSKFEIEIFLSINGKNTAHYLRVSPNMHSEEILGMLPEKNVIDAVPHVARSIHEVFTCNTKEVQILSTSQLKAFLTKRKQQDKPSEFNPSQIFLCCNPFTQREMNKALAGISAEPQTSRSPDYRFVIVSNRNNSYGKENVIFEEEDEMGMMNGLKRCIPKLNANKPVYFCVDGKLMTLVGRQKKLAETNLSEEKKGDVKAYMAKNLFDISGAFAEQRLFSAAISIAHMGDWICFAEGLDLSDKELLDIISSYKTKMVKPMLGKDLVFVFSIAEERVNELVLISVVNVEMGAMFTETFSDKVKAINMAVN